MISDRKYDQKYIYTQEGIKLSYYIGGNTSSSQSLLFLNGLFHGKEAWIKQQRDKFLYGHYKLLFLDYRGCGNSTAPTDGYHFSAMSDDIKAIIDQEGIDRLSIVGYSIGGMLAIFFASRFQERVDRLILLNTGVGISIHARKLIEGIMRLLAEDIRLNNLFAMVYPWFFSSRYIEKLSDLENSLLNEYAYYNRNKTGLKLLIQAIKEKPNLLELLEKIDAATLIIGADQDVIFPPCFQEEIASKVRDSHYHLIKECGHSSYIERYREVNALIKGHLKT